MAFKYHKQYNTKDLDPNYTYYWHEADKHGQTVDDLIKSGFPIFNIHYDDGTEEEYNAWLDKSDGVELSPITVTAEAPDRKIDVSETPEKPPTVFGFQPRGWSTNGKGIGINPIATKVIPPYPFPSPLQFITYKSLLGSRGTYTRGLVNILKNFIRQFGGPEDYYSGKLYNSVHPFTSSTWDPDGNYLRAYTLQDYRGLKPSKIGKGRYIGTEWELYPAFEGNFYGDTIYLPQELEESFSKKSVPIKLINKDDIIRKANTEYLSGTYDARWHGYSTNAKNKTIRFEDVFDIDDSNWLYKVMNYRSKPLIVNLEVPVVFTNDSTKYHFPALIDLIKSDLK